jgi:hypothetical protein
MKNHDPQKPSISKILTLIQHLSYEFCEFWNICYLIPDTTTFHGRILINGRNLPAHLAYIPKDNSIRFFVTPADCLQFNSNISRYSIPSQNLFLRVQSCYHAKSVPCFEHSLISIEETSYFPTQEHEARQALQFVFNAVKGLGEDHDFLTAIKLVNGRFLGTDPEKFETED